MGCLYQLTFPSGKAYIGITAKTAQKRFAAHCSDSQRMNAAVHRAIRKHGATAVRVETLVIADKWDYLCDLERKAIKAYGTRVPNGLNMTDGGDGASIGSQHHLGFKHSEETKAAMSANRRGKKKNLTPAQRERNRVAMTGNNFSTGRVQPVEERVMRGVAQRGIWKGSSSGHVGVSWHKGAGKWRAHITVKGKFIDLGYHSELEEAIAARKAGEKEYVR